MLSSLVCVCVCVCVCVAGLRRPPRRRTPRVLSSRKHRRDNDKKGSQFFAGQTWLACVQSCTHRTLFPPVFDLTAISRGVWFVHADEAPGVLVRAQDISAEAVLVERILDAHCARAVGCLHAPHAQHTPSKRISRVGEREEGRRADAYACVCVCARARVCVCVCVCVPFLTPDRLFPPAENDRTTSRWLAQNAHQTKGPRLTRIKGNLRTGHHLMHGLLLT